MSIKLIIPQMSPMNWITLFILFNMFFLITLIKSYYLGVSMISKFLLNPTILKKYIYMLL